MSDFGFMDAADDPCIEMHAAHEQAMRDGHDGYTDPSTGCFVFTAAYLAARGTCCDSNCRHCPYDARTRTEQEPR